MPSRLEERIGREGGRKRVHDRTERGLSSDPLECVCQRGESRRHRARGFAGKAARFLRESSNGDVAFMKIGLLMVFHESAARPGPFAQELERLGFESLWAPEHPIFPVNPKTPFPQGGPIPDIYAHMSDQFVCLGMAAANTTRLKLGTGVTLVPEHNPLVHAKQV